MLLSIRKGGAHSFLHVKTSIFLFWIVLNWSSLLISSDSLAEFDHIIQEISIFAPLMSRITSTEGGPPLQQVLSSTVNNKNKQQHISMETMRSHLAQAHIGFRKGDPTLASLPDKLPKSQVPQSVNTSVLDLRQTSNEELMRQAEKTIDRSRDDGVLPFKPGIPRNRLAVMSGAEVRLILNQLCTERVGAE